MQKKESLVTQIPTFIKWVGGKSQLLEQLYPLLPAKFNTYHEPFLGGGAVFFFLSVNSKITKAILSDSNAELTNCFVIVKEYPKSLLKQLAEHKTKHSEKHYYEVRSQRIPLSEPIKRAARFIYLNKTCYNGLYRVNQKGEFNVPVGSYKKPAILDANTILAASELLKNVKIQNTDFKQIERQAEKGDFVYLDPPYHPLNQTSSFTSYTKDGFFEAEQRDLRDLCLRLHKKGCHVMVSNSDTSFIKKIYAGAPFKIHKVSAKRMLNCKASGRGPISELVITNY